MITPKFSCSQTDSIVSVEIYCPSVRANDLELNIDNTLVTIHINPYFLRLNFSGNLLEDDDDDISSASYNPTSGYLTLNLSKESKGQVFQDLDLLSKLLAPRPTTVHTPTIEVLDTQNNDDDFINQAFNLNISDERDEFIQAALSDWQMPQHLPENNNQIEIPSSKMYGFLDSYTGYFRHITHTDNEINDLGHDPETCPPSERVQRMRDRENSKWDEEYYIADYMDTDQIDDIIQWEHPILEKTDEITFSEAENMMMLNLPKKEYIMSESQEGSLYLALVTVLFSYAYETRSNQLDPSPESAWTLCILTPLFTSLSCPQTTGGSTWKPDDINSTLISSYRRSLAFPLYRSWTFSERCKQDVINLLGMGKRTILKCLLWMKDLLDHHEVYYVYSKIWMEDLCVWIQAYAKDDKLQELSKAISLAVITKADIGWDLEELEVVAGGNEPRESDSDDE